MSYLKKGSKSAFKLSAFWLFVWKKVDSNFNLPFISHTQADLNLRSQTLHCYTLSKCIRFYNMTKVKHLPCSLRKIYHIGCSDNFKDFFVRYIEFLPLRTGFWFDFFRIQLGSKLSNKEFSMRKFCIKQMLRIGHIIKSNASKATRETPLSTFVQSNVTAYIQTC